MKPHVINRFIKKNVKFQLITYSKIMNFQCRNRNLTLLVDFHHSNSLMKVEVHLSEGMAMGFQKTLYYPQYRFPLPCPRIANKFRRKIMNFIDRLMI
ncbi:hypothetical protein WA1_27835 [Scytonema hofmannii PCC 7110]|uniref:Uncharacterized protein n=1 Tax=Scytonema hofmannii PCC 7110 TaxID=128403 RepID=A0A139X6T0_9CYAN|nr:hypothetical protein WA1_27835 [Scytonema hofmannii PCC 7110]